MNDDNLIPLDKRTKSEQREIQKDGGKKSGEVRRRKKSLKQMLTLILESEPVFIPEELRSIAERMNIDSNDMLDTVSIFVRALTDIQAQKYMDELLDRNPQLSLKKREVALKKRLAEKIEYQIQDPYEGWSREELSDDNCS